MAGLGNWLKAVRDHPKRPSPMQCFALDRLALRLDWTTGEGFASTAEVAADAGCGERTVRRATAWARKHGLLVMNRRGHRLSDGAASASEWRTCLDSQPVTPDRLRASQPVTPDTLRGVPTGQPGRPNRSAGASQPVSTAPPSKSSSSKSSSSNWARAGADRIIRAVFPDATDDEINTIVEGKIINGARDVEAVLAHEARNGTLRLPCDTSDRRHSNACRDGNSQGCATGWCECRCHTEPKPAP
jgi:hypothetical protein